MGVEIERKFLLASDSWRGCADAGIRMVQGYFDTGITAPTLRVRIAGETAFLTVKGRVSGCSRSEFEYEIPVADAEAMLQEFCEGRVVEKCRYHVPYGSFVWEVDEYFGANAGLFTAEIELPEESTDFAVPPWAGMEVTADRRYSNGSLSRYPFRNW